MPQALTVDQIDEQIAQLKQQRKDALVRERQEEIETRKVIEEAIGAYALSLVGDAWRSLDPEAVAAVLDDAAPSLSTARLPLEAKTEAAPTRARWRALKPKAAKAQKKKPKKQPAKGTEGGPVMGP